MRWQAEKYAGEYFCCLTRLAQVERSTSHLRSPAQICCREGGRWLARPGPGRGQKGANQMKRPGRGTGPWTERGRRGWKDGGDPTTCNVVSSYHRAQTKESPTPKDRRGVCRSVSELRNTSRSTIGAETRPVGPKQQPTPARLTGQGVLPDAFGHGAMHSYAQNRW